MNINKKHIVLLSALFLSQGMNTGINTLYAADANVESVLGNPASTIRADDIPAGDSGYYYVEGAAAAQDSIPIPSYSKTVKFGAQIKAGMYRSCGELNPFKNFKGRITAQLEEKLDQIKGIAQAIPQLIVDSAIEYAMAKINPTLHQLFQKKIDEYIELFEINIKSCEDVQADLAANPNAGIFDNLFQIAIADQWKIAIDDGTFENTRKFKEKLAKKAREKGLTMADGKNYGGKNMEPINFIQSISKAGINIISGRNTTSQWNNAFTTADKKDKPITKVFEKPEDLVNFIEDIYGSTEYRLSEQGTPDAVKTKAGVGYYRRYSENRNKNIEYLTKYVNKQVSRQAFEEATGILIPPAQIDDLGLMEPYARQVQIEQLAKEYAVQDMNKKLIFARNALNAGVNAPDMVQSKLSGTAEKAHRKVYFMMLDDIAELAQLKY